MEGLWYVQSAIFTKDMRKLKSHLEAEILQEDEQKLMGSTAGEMWERESLTAECVCVFRAPLKTCLFQKLLQGIINCLRTLGSVLRFLHRWCIFQWDSCAALGFVSPQ